MPSHFLRLLLFCLVISNGFCNAENSLTSKIPVIQINTEGLSALDIGLEIGRKTKLIFTDIEKRYDAYLFASFSQLRFNDALNDRLPKLRQHVDDDYRKELEGVASTWSLIHDNKLGDGFLSRDEYWLLNLLPDIGLPTNGTGFGVLQQVSKENSSIIGRNLDLKSTPQLRSLQTITVYQHADNRVVVNIGFAGLISVITGFNQSGLFVAHFNAAPDSSYQNQYQTKKEKQKIEAHVFSLRKALETLNSAKQATNYLSNNSYGISSNTLVADKKDIRVLEYSKSGKVKVRHWDSQLRANNQWDREFQIAVVDCHVLSSMTNNCRRAKDNFRWKRLHSLAQHKNDVEMDTLDISKVMMDTKNQYYEILGTDTIQSMIFLPASGHLYLYAAPIKTSKLPPLYQVYYQDIMPPSLRHVRGKTHILWWLAGLLTLMTITLWWIRKSMKKTQMLGNQ